MTENTEEKFDSLKNKVDDLIKVCSEMKVKNQILKASEDNWQTERKQPQKWLHVRIKVAFRLLLPVSYFWVRWWLCVFLWRLERNAAHGGQLHCSLCYRAH